MHPEYDEYDYYEYYYYGGGGSGSGDYDDPYRFNYDLCLVRVEPMDLDGESFGWNIILE